MENVTLFHICSDAELVTQTADLLGFYRLWGCQVEEKSELFLQN